MSEYPGGPVRLSGVQVADADELLSENLVVARRALYLPFHVPYIAQPQHEP